MDQKTKKKKKPQKISRYNKWGSTTIWTFDERFVEQSDQELEGIKGRKWSLHTGRFRERNVFSFIMGVICPRDITTDYPLWCFSIVWQHKMFFYTCLFCAKTDYFIFGNRVFIAAYISLRTNWAKITSHRAAFLLRWVCLNWPHIFFIEFENLNLKELFFCTWLCTWWMRIWRKIMFYVFKIYIHPPPSTEVSYNTILDNNKFKAYIRMS